MAFKSKRDPLTKAARRPQATAAPRVLIADDHELVRRGLRQILAEAFPKVVVTEAADARQTLQALTTKRCDIALLDINLPDRNGIDLLQELKARYPRMPVVVLSAFPEDDYAVRAFKLGAAGYVSKQSASSELVAAIRKALAGRRYVSPSLAESLAASVAGETPTAPHELLSNRELQVLRAVAVGKSLKEIAAELSLSEKTIGTYRTRISKKLELSTNVELARYATRHQLID
jgi:DNA-binding NarL/FixJ family response regulator